jgi:hypothetical protein
MSTKKLSLKRSRLPAERDAKVIGASFSSDIEIYTHHDGAALTRAHTLEGAVKEPETDGRVSSATDPGDAVSRTSGCSHKESSAWLRRWDKRQKLEKEWRFERGDDTLVTTDIRPANDASSIMRSERDTTLTDRSTASAHNSPLLHHHQQMSPASLQPANAISRQQNKQTQLFNAAAIHPQHTPPVPPTSPASQHGDFVVLQTSDYQSTSPTLDDIAAERFDLTPNSPDWHYLRALDRLEGRRMGPRTPSSRSEIIPDSPTLKGLGIQGLRLSDQSFQDRLDRFPKVKPDTSSETSSDLSLLHEEQATFEKMARIAAREAAAQTESPRTREVCLISGAHTGSFESQFRVTSDSPDMHVQQSRQHLLVKRSPKHENLVPERDSMFFRNIQECARQEAILRAATASCLQPIHPAFRDDIRPASRQEGGWNGQEEMQCPILETLHLRRQVVENLQHSARQRLIDRRLKGKSTVDVSNLQEQKQQQHHQVKMNDDEHAAPSLTSDTRRASSASMILPVIHHAFILSPHRSSEGDLRA